MVALAPCSHQGRSVRARREHTLCRDGYGASPHPGALPAHLLCSRPSRKRDQRSPTLPEIRAHGLSSLRGQPVSLVVAFGRLRVTCNLTPRGFKDNPVGLSDDGDDPDTLTQTRCPCT